MNLRYKKAFIGITLLIYVSMFNGCVSELTDETPLALVNGEQVTYGEFKRELQGFHLRKEEKIGTGPMDIKGFLDKLIRKRLFIQEGIRIGLHKHPDVKLALDSELKRQAVFLLHREEIDNIVKVSDDDAWGEYCDLLNNRLNEVEKIREGFSMDPNNQSKEVRDYIIGLRKGARLETDPNFVWHGEESRDPNKILARVNGKCVTYGDLSTAINESKGERDWKSVLQWLMDKELLEQKRKRLEPNRDFFEKMKKRLKKNLLKQERKKREDAFLKELRENARISKEIIDPNSLLRDAKDPNQPVAWLNDAPITIADLKSNIKVEDLKQETPEKRKQIIEKRLQYIIDCRLVDQEALGRGYGERPEVKKAVKSAKEYIVYNKFFKEHLIPSIKIKDEEVETYYRENEDLFRTPIYVKIDEIRFDTEEDANQIRSELEAGADFAFLSRRSLPHRITSQHWIPIHQVPLAIKEGLDKVKEGNWFGTVLWEEGYSIFLLKRRRGGEQVSFDKAKKDAHERLWKERYNQSIKKWENILRSSSEIVVYEERLQAILSGAEGQGDNDTI